jgi:hypothetical protein
MYSFAVFLAWAGTSLLVALVIAHLVRMPPFATRIALVAYAAIFCLAGLFPWSQAMKVGSDLSGGTILVYGVHQPVPEEFSINKSAKDPQADVEGPRPSPGKPQPSPEAGLAEYPSPISLGSDHWRPCLCSVSKSGSCPDRPPKRLHPPGTCARLFPRCSFQILFCRWIV